MTSHNSFFVLEDELRNFFDLVDNVLRLLLELFFLLLLLGGESWILIFEILLAFEGLQLLGKLFHMLVKLLFVLKCFGRKTLSRSIKLVHFSADLLLDLLQNGGIT